MITAEIPAQGPSAPSDARSWPTSDSLHFEPRPWSHINRFAEMVGPSEGGIGRIWEEEMRALEVHALLVEDSEKRIPKEEAICASAQPFGVSASVFLFF